MIQGFRNILAQVEVIIQENCPDLDMENTDISICKKIHSLAAYNLKYNLNLIIFELEARELEEVCIYCSFPEEEKSAADKTKRPLLDFNKIDFSSFDFNDLIAVIQEILRGLKDTYLSRKKIKEIMLSDDPSEKLLVLKLGGICELLDNILMNNRIFLDFYQVQNITIISDGIEDLIKNMAEMMTEENI